jgi:hypothetical protein
VPHALARGFIFFCIRGIRVTTAQLLPPAKKLAGGRHWQPSQSVTPHALARGFILFCIRGIRVTTAQLLPPAKKLVGGRRSQPSQSVKIFLICG